MGGRRRAATLPFRPAARLLLPPRPTRPPPPPRQQRRCLKSCNRRPPRTRQRRHICCIRAFQWSKSRRVENVSNDFSPSLRTSTSSSVLSKLPLPLWTPRKGFAWSNSPVALRERYVRHLDIADVDTLVVGAINSTTLEHAVVVTAHPIMTVQEIESIVTIYHHGMSDSWNLLIANTQHRQALLQTVPPVLRLYRSVLPWISHTALMVRYFWYHVDVDQNGFMNKTEFLKLCSAMNLQHYTAAKAFDEYCKQLQQKHRHRHRQDSRGGDSPKTPKELSYLQCRQVLQQLQDTLTQGSDWSGPLWKDLFVSTTVGSSSPNQKHDDDGDRRSISPSTFYQRFLLDIQHESPDTTTLHDAQQLSHAITGLGRDTEWKLSNPTKPAPTGDGDVFVTKEQWEEFLLSPFNSAYDPAIVAEPSSSSSYFDQPISRYWINTSHNTYLTGDQLQSKSSVQAYVASLERGSKCLELDCWDGTKDQSQAIVYHGHTLTSKILFVDILQVVRAYIQAHPTTLPIILSLENHCSPPFQTTMAQQLKDVFGELLYIPPLSQIKGDVATPLPSPNELRGKVVIKGKRPPDPEDEDKDDAPPGATAADSLKHGEDPYAEAIQQVEHGTKNNKTKTKSSSQHKAAEIVPELAALTLLHGTKFKAFETSIATITSHMHSIGETKIGKLLSKDDKIAGLWREYNQEHLTRTYPAGVRVDSSNYNPILAWSVGCQLVALNFQTHDVPLLLNDGRFQQAGGCGYVLKPPSVSGTNVPPQPRRLQISIISGHCLPKPKGVAVGEAIDPYVRVELYDVQTSSNGKWDAVVGESLKTSVVMNNGMYPSWPATKGKQPQKVAWQVQHPDVAMVLFQVLDEDLGVDDKIASAAIPVNALRAGYRSVPLYPGDKTNRRTGPFAYANLLVKIDWDEP